MGGVPIGFVAYDTKSQWLVTTGEAERKAESADLEKPDTADSARADVQREH